MFSLGMLTKEKPNARIEYARLEVKQEEPIWIHLTILKVKPR
jgi:hypothetical protein